MVIIRRDVDRLRDALAGARGPLRVASIEVDADPLALARAGSHLFSSAGYFGAPDGVEVGTLGVAWRAVAPPSSDRFDHVAAAIDRLRVDHPDVRFLVAGSFLHEGPTHEEWDGFGPAACLLPSLWIVRDAAGTRLGAALAEDRSGDHLLHSLATLVDPGVPPRTRAADHVLEGRPAPGRWADTVAEAVASIRDGVLDKVVLARSVVISSDVMAPPFDLVARLRSSYGGCFTFGWQEGAATFIGATPELLVERRGYRVRSQPLAGSAARGEGDEADRAIGEALMSSSKNRAEHRMVVEDLRRRLEAVTDRLSVASEPSIRQMTHVQHLATELRGDLSDPLDVIRLAGLVHPTPAVAGTPRRDALALIAKGEQIDRGWYAGPIGWADAHGDGQLALALRCALIRGTRAHLYAGAGIVADSDPAAELDETRLKLRPMLDLLVET